ADRQPAIGEILDRAVDSSVCPRFLIQAAMLFFAASMAFADSYQPTSGELSAIRSKLAELSSGLDRLGAKPDAALLADVEVYRKAGEWILRYPEEFYTKAYVANALKVLDHGIARADELAKGEPAWPRQKGRLVRGYRSKVDGSVQPYGLIIPESYDGSKLVRLDVVLHGRGATLNEVSFITAHESATPVPATQDFITLEVYGRGNNAYRWAGETDVFEALESVEARYRIDPARIVLRGFSMGGAGTWHIGLHHPSRWVAMEAGAGFTETRVYAKLKEIPPYQASTLHIYDAVDYSLNAVNLPVVGYGGEIDPQLQGSTNIRDQLTKEGFHFRHEGLNWFGTDIDSIFLVGPQTAHKFHPESKKTSDEFINRAVAKGRDEHPAHIRFVTYTPRFDGDTFWIRVEALDREYERAEIDAKHSVGETVVSTKNVSRLELTVTGKVTIDGKNFKAGPLTLEKVRGAWSAAAPTGLRKHHGLQGPIDDAFMDGFVCVRPTGTPSSAATGEYARRTLDQFARDFAKYFRGDVRVKDDREIKDADIAARNLILFGDPGSNSVIARILRKLPLQWTADTITFGTKKF